MNIILTLATGLFLSEKPVNPLVEDLSGGVHGIGHLPR